MKITDLEFIEINPSNLEIFKNLAQAYEAEFSSLTHKMPNDLGLFSIDILPCAPYIGYLLYHQKVPIGFCVIDIGSEIKDVAEFYIAPVMRKKNLGYQFAVTIFNKYPGKWQVRQIKNAIDATNFWRNVIAKYTQGHYEEALVQDADWGTVTRQRFHSLPDIK